LIRFVCVLLAGIALAGGARAADPAVFTVGAGVYDLVAHRTQYGEARLMYRHGQGLFDGDGTFRGLKPFIAGMAATNGALYGYAGLAAPFVWDRWEFEASAGLGAYDRGRRGLDLGQTFEFHLGVAVSYAVSENVRAGVAIAHISNAGTGRVNPGLNSALATIGVAF
jgi:hypothetical protein